MEGIIVYIMVSILKYEQS